MACEASAAPDWSLARAEGRGGGRGDTWHGEGECRVVGGGDTWNREDVGVPPPLAETDTTSV